MSLHWWMIFSVRTFNDSISSGVRVDRMRSATSDCAAQRFSASAALLGQRIAFRRNTHGTSALASYSELGVELLAAHLVLHRRGHVFGAAVGQQSADEGAKPGLAFLPALLATFLSAFLATFLSAFLTVLALP